MPLTRKKFETIEFPTYEKVPMLRLSQEEIMAMHYNKPKSRHKSVDFDKFSLIKDGHSENVVILKKP
jgi:hypothetical protein